MSNMIKIRLFHRDSRWSNAPRSIRVAWTSPGRTTRFTKKSRPRTRLRAKGEISSRISPVQKVKHSETWKLAVDKRKDIFLYFLPNSEVWLGMFDVKRHGLGSHLPSQVPMVCLYCLAKWSFTTGVGEKENHQPFGSIWYKYRALLRAACTKHHKTSQNIKKHSSQNRVAKDVLPTAPSPRSMTSWGVKVAQSAGFRDKVCLRWFAQRELSLL